MRNYLTFGSINSSTYGVYISGSGVFNVPERQYDFISVPGRNGDLIGNEKRMANIELTYPAFMYSSFTTNMRGFFSALSAAAYLTFKNRQSSSCGYRPPTWATFPSWTGAFPM